MLWHQPGLSPQRSPTMCAVLSSVCVTTVGNSGVYVYLFICSNMAQHKQLLKQLHEQDNKVVMCII